MRRHPYQVREAMKKEVEGVIEAVQGPQKWW